MRLASFNVENLFDRARALNQESWDQGRPILERHARINRLLQKAVYSNVDKEKIKELLKELGLDKRDDGGEFALLRQNRGRLLKRPKSGGLEIVADGRGDWIGWVELKTEPVNELAMQHTAMVMRDVAADVLGVIEADNRIALKRFSGQLLEWLGVAPYDHIMVIDGNDDRGIDVGVMTRVRYEITGIRSHVDDADAVGQVFSRDCAEYTITAPSGERFVLLVNHLKSKGYGTAVDSNDKRRRQAMRIAEIYQRLRADGEDNVAVVGDFNDTPMSAPLAPLLQQTDLNDIATHPSFTDDGRPGTFANGTKSQKIDYLLLSPALYGAVSGGGVFRTGVWGGKNGTLWAIYPTMTKPVHAASDHAAVYADIAI